MNPIHNGANQYDSGFRPSAIHLRLVTVLLACVLKWVGDSGQIEISRLQWCGVWRELIAKGIHQLVHWRDAYPHSHPSRAVFKWASFEQASCISFLLFWLEHEKQKQETDFQQCISSDAYLCISTELEFSMFSHYTIRKL
jgi:hypothetical protein